MEIAGSIPVTKDYLLQFNTCTRLWLTELEYCPPDVQIKCSVRDSIWIPDFDMKTFKEGWRTYRPKTLWI